MFCADCMTLLMLAPSAAGFDSDVIGLGSIASKWCWWCGWAEAVSEDDMPPVCVVCCVLCRCEPNEGGSWDCHALAAATTVSELGVVRVVCLAKSAVVGSESKNRAWPRQERK